MTHPADYDTKARKLLHAAECPVRRFIQYDGFLEKVFDPPRFDDRFGVCPECGDADGYLNVGRTHWFFCDAHKTRWTYGANLFSTWEGETRADWEANQNKLSTYREVEPTFRPKGADDDIFRSETYDLQRSGVPVRVQVLAGTEREDVIRLLEKITDWTKHTSDAEWRELCREPEDKKEADSAIPF